MASMAENKCEVAGIEHAWIYVEAMGRFNIEYYEMCKHYCGLKRTKSTTCQQGWSYSDGRPDEITK